MAIVVKTFKPGDPEFEALAASVTPIGEIRGRRDPKLRISADQDNSRVPGRRKETVNKLR